MKKRDEQSHGAPSRRRHQFLLFSAAVIAVALGVAMASLHVAYKDLAVRMQVAQTPSEPETSEASGIESHNPYLADEQGNPAVLPTVLSNDDIERYRQITEFEKNREWRKTDRMIERLESRVLVGHVLADRYLSEAYVTSYRELKQWLDEFSDMPDAPAIYRLANAKKAPSIPSELEAVNASPSLRGYGDYHSRPRQADYLEKSAWAGRDAAKASWDHVHGMIRKGDIIDARELLLSPKTRAALSPLEYDLSLWSLANSYFVRGMDKPAFQLASQAAARSDEVIPAAHWTAGIAAWRLGNYSSSARHFTAMANSDARLSGWDRAAAAFWAYRSFDKLNNPDKAQAFLRKASEHPRTFYGILARKKLGQGLALDRNPHPLDEETIAELYNIPAVQRAVAFTQMGDREQAEAELRQIFPGSDRPLRQKLLSLAMALDIPAVQIPMGKILARSEERNYDFAVYPMPGWQPPEGFTVDPALVFAFARQESGFHAKALSHDGAMGIMQLMPQTAHSIMRRISFSSKSNLSEPVVNISVGQSYLDYLLSQTAVNGNLIFLAAAYNAGPGKLAEWISSIPHRDDPLLFIESIPYSETRNYIGQVMASYWIYSEMTGGKGRNPMTALLSGSWPYYRGSVQQVADAWNSGLTAN